MRAERFLASLEHETAANAIAQIEGWLDACKRYSDATMTEDEYRLVIAALLGLRQGRKPAVLFRGMVGP